ncbi:MAG TPA: helix-turn-helix domain-containing protein [Ignavibacteriaceae bacterium]|nr:helix-turn-helix domain-containing protein [Ignavibacteriaceae bacterium]
MVLTTKLQQIGLTKREAEVYLALLQRKEFTAPELTKITTITRTKIYEILQNLVHKGICTESSRNGNKVYRCIDPKIALQNIVNNYEQSVEQKKIDFELKQKIDIEQKKKAADLLEKELISFHENSSQSFEPFDYIEILTDKRQIGEKWVTIQQSTKKELLVFTKPPYTTPSLADNIEEEKELFRKQKLVVKGLYEYDDLTPEEVTNLVKTVELYQEIGEEARLIEKLPMKLVISDETLVMFALNDRISLKPNITSMVVDHPDYATALKKVFESYWANGLSIENFKKTLNS